MEKETIDDRVARLMKQFNGNVKYKPMLQDHPKWTDEECVAFAKRWDAIARQQRNTTHIPYGRNIFKAD